MNRQYPPLSRSNVALSIVLPAISGKCAKHRLGAPLRLSCYEPRIDVLKLLARIRQRFQELLVTRH
jgi:hypothetical protein